MPRAAAPAVDGYSSGRWIPLEEPSGGPNFYRFGSGIRYRINVDNNGDAVDDIVYEFTFNFVRQGINPNTFLNATGPITSLTDPDYNVRQSYSMAVVRNGVRTVLGTNLAAPPNNIGPTSTPNYPSLAAAAVHTVGNTKVFAGQREEAFFVDLGSGFDLATLRPYLPAYRPRTSASQPGRDAVSGFNVHTIALQVPISSLTSDGKPLRTLANGQPDPNDPRAVIGVYSTTERRSTRVLSGTGGLSESGSYVQVSRLGQPLINELFIPYGLKDRFNASDAAADKQWVPYIEDPELARLERRLYNLFPVPTPPRRDVVQFLFIGIPGLNQAPGARPADLLRLNMAIQPATTPDPLGVIGGDNAGYPNGRRLIDDTVDILLRLAAGGTSMTPTFNQPPNNLLGDGANTADPGQLNSFPYLGTPHDGYTNGHGRQDGYPIPN